MRTIAVVVVLVHLAGWLFLWALCRIAADADRRMADFHRRAGERS